jgi:hypothetical protein
MMLTFLSAGRLALIVSLITTVGCSPSSSATQSESASTTNKSAIVLSATGLDTEGLFALSLAPSTVVGPINGTRLYNIQVTLANLSGTSIEFSQMMTFFRVEDDRVTHVICDVGFDAPAIEPRLCGIEDVNWFQLPPGQSAASVAPFFLPNAYLEPGVYVVAAPVRDSAEKLWLATATLEVTK